MSQDRPHLPELLRTVRELLDELGPKVAPELRYDIRVASFLVSIAEREVAHGPAIDEKNRAELAALLGDDGASLPALHGALAARLRRGELDGRLDEVLVTLLAQVADKVRIVRPSHLDKIHR